MPHEVQVEAVEAELDEAARHVAHVEPCVAKGHPLAHDAVVARRAADGRALALDSERAGLAVGAREPRRAKVPRRKGGGRGRVRRGEGDLVRRDELREGARRQAGQKRGHEPELAHSRRLSQHGAKLNTMSVV